MHHHARLGLTQAAGDQGAFALHFDHAGAAVAVGTVALGILEAQVRNGFSGALGDLPEGVAGVSRHGCAIQREGKGLLVHKVLLTL